MHGIGGWLLENFYDQLVAGRASPLGSTDGCQDSCLNRTKTRIIVCSWGRSTKTSSSRKSPIVTCSVKNGRRLRRGGLVCVGERLYETRFMHDSWSLGALTQRRLYWCVSPAGHLIIQYRLTCTRHQMMCDNFKYQARYPVDSGLHGDTSDTIPQIVECPRVGRFWAGIQAGRVPCLYRRR